jgi:hypothetical protein
MSPPIILPWGEQQGGHLNELWIIVGFPASLATGRRENRRLYQTTYTGPSEITLSIARLPAPEPFCRSWIHFFCSCSYRLKVKHDYIDVLASVPVLSILLIIRTRESGQNSRQLASDPYEGVPKQIFWYWAIRRAFWDLGFNVAGNPPADMVKAFNLSFHDGATGGSGNMVCWEGNEPSLAGISESQSPLSSIENMGKVVAKHVRILLVEERRKKCYQRKPSVEDGVKSMYSTTPVITIIHITIFSL